MFFTEYYSVDINQFSKKSHIIDFQSGVAIALVTFAREGANKRELEVVKGEYLEILNMERKWWKVRNRNQEVRDWGDCCLQSSKQLC